MTLIQKFFNVFDILMVDTKTTRSKRNENENKELSASQNFVKTSKIHKSGPYGPK